MKELRKQMIVPNNVKILAFLSKTNHTPRFFPPHSVHNWHMVLPFELKVKLALY